jgi:Tol biopolymer transport system component
VNRTAIMITALLLLVRLPSGAQEADSSPIAFFADDDIWLVSPESLALTRLTDNESTDGFPSWSPDGSRIVFNSNRGGRPAGIFIMNADGSNPVDTGLQGVHPAFSPDGRRLAYRLGNSLFIADADGGNPRSFVIAPDLGDFYFTKPSWNPAGDLLVFQSSDPHLFIMQEADGPCDRFWENNCSSLTLLTDSRADNSLPSWSPDGKLIAFQDHREVSVIAPDGTGFSQLTHDDLPSGEPSWSPDGARIAFTAGHFQSRRIFTMKRDGSDVRQITFEGVARAPAWSPRLFGSAVHWVTWGSAKRNLRQ